MKKFRPKNQVMYVPNHAEGDLSHPDCEAGFVTSVPPNGTVFCRFWSKYHKGLRTQANSEGCKPKNLVLFESRAQVLVNQLWSELGYE